MQFQQKCGNVQYSWMFGESLMQLGYMQVILEQFGQAIIVASFLSGRKSKSFCWRRTLCVQKSRERFVSRFRPCPCFVQPAHIWCPRSIWRSCGCVGVRGWSLWDRGRCVRRVHRTLQRRLTAGTLRDSRTRTSQQHTTALHGYTVHQ